VDSTVLPDIFTDDPPWRPRSQKALREVRTAGLAGINPLIYAETSLAFDNASDLDRELDSLPLTRLQLPCRCEKETHFGAQWPAHRRGCS